MPLAHNALFDNSLQEYNRTLPHFELMATLYHKARSSSTKRPQKRSGMEINKFFANWQAILSGRAEKFSSPLRRGKTANAKHAGETPFSLPSTGLTA